jgi:hypothetical protein
MARLCVTVLFALLLILEYRVRVEALSEIVVVGSKFFKQDTGEQFFLKGLLAKVLSRHTC